MNLLDSRLMSLGGEWVGWSLDFKLDAEKSAFMSIAVSYFISHQVRKGLVQSNLHFHISRCLVKDNPLLPNPFVVVIRGLSSFFVQVGKEVLF